MGQSEEQLESQWDKMLKIKTTGRDDSHADAFCYPYEPTPYCVLERLANSGLIQKKADSFRLWNRKRKSVLFPFISDALSLCWY